MLPAERAVQPACWDDSADLKQPDTKPNSKIHKNAVEPRAAPCQSQVLLPLGLGEVGLNYSTVLLLRRTLPSSTAYANPRLVVWSQVVYLICKT